FNGDVIDTPSYAYRDFRNPKNLVVHRETSKVSLLNCLEYRTQIKTLWTDNNRFIAIVEAA
ncbi:MAG: hypothetical protein ACE5NM_05610, partial [Sedimentisphaerales bacterium]